MRTFLACSLWILLVRPPAGRAEDARGRPSGEEPADTLTLRRSFQLALRQSETVAIRREVLRATQGRVLQAVSTALPKVAFNDTEEWLDRGASSSRPYLPERKFTLNQPVFSGFREFAAISGAGAERRERTSQERLARHLLWVDVSDAFYFLRQHREDLSALEAVRQALVERIDELKGREQLGRSRTSEVVNAEAQLRTVEADIAETRSDEATAENLLRFLTGRETLGPLIDDEPPPAPLDAEATYVAKADQRPDVEAAKAAWRVANNAVTVAQSGFWPEVDLTNDYYTKRVGANTGIDWDVYFTISVPLFQGGAVVGKVREALSTARQAKLLYERTRREGTLEIRDAYAQLIASQARVAVLAQALQADEENYRLQRDDYRLNLVNNLEVLRALENLENTRRDVIKETYKAKRLYQTLRASIGEVE